MSSDVKRYELQAAVEVVREGHPYSEPEIMPKGAQVVSCADYDALASQLEVYKVDEEMVKELERRLAEAQQRCAELELRL